MSIDYAKRNYNRCIKLAEQIIDDIQNNEWYCEQGCSESEMTNMEKEYIIEGLKMLIQDYDRRRNNDK